MVLHGAILRRRTCDLSSRQSSCALLCVRRLPLSLFLDNLCYCNVFMACVTVAGYLSDWEELCLSVTALWPVTKDQGDQVLAQARELTVRSTRAHDMPASSSCTSVSTSLDAGPSVTSAASKGKQLSSWYLPPEFVTSVAHRYWKFWKISHSSPLYSSCCSVLHTSPSTCSFSCKLEPGTTSNTLQQHIHQAVGAT